MAISSRHNSILATVLLAMALVLFNVTALRADVEPLGDEELSAVWGQSLLEIRNTNYGGYDFARFTLSADLDISANLGGITAGAYESGSLNLLDGAGLALDIGTLRLGRSDGGESRRLVTLTNPYLELAYSNIGSDYARSLVGMRMGFQGVDGDIGVAMSALTGALRVELGNDQFYDSLLPPDTVGLVPLQNIGMLRAGNAEGPSRDFFVSVLSQALTYPSVKGVASGVAMPGIWINWRDRLTGLLGATPPNQSK